MTQGLVVRPGGPADHAVLLELWSETARAAHPFVPGEGRGARRRLVAQRFLPQSQLHVAEAGGRCLGFAAVIGEEMGGLFVHPESQRNGIGTALLSSVCAPRSRLTVTVFARRESALAFYRARGFRELDRGLDGETSEPLLRLVWEAVS